jgi:hypothetical protein
LDALIGQYVGTTGAQNSVNCSGNYILSVLCSCFTVSFAFCFSWFLY